MVNKDKSKSNVFSIVPRLEAKKSEEKADIYSIEEVLDEVLAERKTVDDEYSVFRAANKLLVIALDDSDEMYCTGFIQSGMKMSECIALMEVMKQRFLEQMGV